MKTINTNDLSEYLVILENDILRLEILPKLGGKITSVYYKEKEFELAAKNPKDHYMLSDKDHSFGNADASGFDDTFPTIVPCKLKYLDNEYVYTDHGEVWRKELFVNNNTLTGTFVEMHFTSNENPYKFYKSIELKDNQIEYHYNIENTSNKDFPCLFTLHNLVRYEENMKIIYPKNTNSFINVSDTTQTLGEKGQIHSVNNTVYDFNGVPSASSHSTEKYYVYGKVNEGYCGYHYPNQCVNVELLYDAQALPYLGFWVTAGGFRGDYNCALEPSNGFHDGVEIAQKNNSIYILEPNKPLEIKIITKITNT